METREYRTLDRASWPSGPWDSEPDKAQWPDAATGLPCLALRNWIRGNWCGYVGVPPGHKLHGQDKDSELTEALRVHGGLTFANECEPDGDEATRICHTPAPGEPEHVWWLGFDCAHFDDYSPGDVQMEKEQGYPYTITRSGPYAQTYKTLDYVKAECAQLAQQIVDV